MELLTKCRRWVKTGSRNSVDGDKEFGERAKDFEDNQEEKWSYFLKCWVEADGRAPKGNWPLSTGRNETRMHIS